MDEDGNSPCCCCSRNCATLSDIPSLFLYPLEKHHLPRAAELKYGTVVALQKQLKASEDELAKKDNGKRLLKEEVTEADIAEIISKWTGEALSWNSQR